MTKQQVDKVFGKGRWKGIRRRGIWQNGKVRGIDNARTSGTNFAAWLQDTIMTSPHDIGIQILCWLFNGEEGSTRFDLKNTFALWVGLSADDLADAYHGVPNIPAQMNLCVVAMRNPHTGTTEFYISKSHLFGLSAAVVNFNRLPELMTAICRRIGHAPSWHFFDDQGTLDFETAGPPHPGLPGLSASEWVDFVYTLVGRPFKKEKHLPPQETESHLGLKNEFKNFQQNEVSLEPKPGKLQELLDILKEFRNRENQLVSLKEIMTIAGKLIFLMMSCFNKMARGGLQPFFQWLAQHSAYTTNGISKQTTVCKKPPTLTDKFLITASLAIGMEFFIRNTTAHA